MSNAQFIAVTPSDTVALPGTVDVIYVGITGDLAVMGAGDTVAVTFKAVPVGWFDLGRPIAQVMATNTTATDLVACPKYP